MQTIQLKTEEYQLVPSTDNLFQLRPLPSHSSPQFDLQYNYAPLICSKTEKIIPTLPSISQEKSHSTLFYTQFDAEFNLKQSLLIKHKAIDAFKSMKNLAQTEKIIYVSKPSSRYCQICKDTFSDYLQHIGHSSHQKKIKEGVVTEKDFVEIQRILMNRNQSMQKKKQNEKQKKAKVRIHLDSSEQMKRRETEQRNGGEQQQNDKKKGLESKKQKCQNSSKKWLEMVNEQEEMFSGMKLGSKKRIIENEMGEREFTLFDDGDKREVENVEGEFDEREQMSKQGIKKDERQDEMRREPSLKTIESLGDDSNKPIDF